MKVLKAWKCNLKGLSRKEYEILRDMCHASKNVYNSALYNIRQNYFQQGEFLRYEANYFLMKDSEDYNYLGNVAQQSMKAAGNAFQAFFALCKKVKQGSYSADAVRIPHYLKKDSLYKVEFNSPRDQQKHIEQGFYIVPMSRFLSNKYPGVKVNLQVPPHIRDKRVRQIHIIPRKNGKYFESVFIFDDEISDNRELDQSKALAIDLGINNFATCATSDGNAFIIDGRMLKSQNQWYNKERARLSSIKDCQHISGDTFRISKLTEKRNRRVDYFIYCASKYIVNYCISHHIANLVVGYNEGFQDSPRMNKKTKQIFCLLPYGKFKQRLKLLCERYDLNYNEQEESYTSKASFFDNDSMPIWNPLNPKQGIFSGDRIHRGLYKRCNGVTLNADVNGALNILRKSKLNQINHLEQCRGEVVTPLRIRLS